MNNNLSYESRDTLFYRVGVLQNKLQIKIKELNENELINQKIKNDILGFQNKINDIEKDLGV